MKELPLSLVLLTPLLASAQSYSIGWYKIAGGGVLSADTTRAAVYSVNRAVSTNVVMFRLKE
jgi:hypothetical protein